MIVCSCRCGEIYVRKGGETQAREFVLGVAQCGRCRNIMAVSLWDDPRFEDLQWECQFCRPPQINSVNPVTGRVVFVSFGRPGTAMDISETIDAKTVPIPGWRMLSLQPWSKWLAGLEKAAG